MTSSPNHKPTSAHLLVRLALAALVAAVAGCKTTESRDGTQPQTTARPAAPGPMLGTGY
jgi:hypothetical protein